LRPKAVIPRGRTSPPFHNLSLIGIGGPFGSAPPASWQVLAHRARAYRRTSCIMNLSDGEKLVLMVLADMYKHLEIKGEFDPDFISTTISGGHLWGFRWKYTHIPFEPSENPPEVSETVDILDMWSSLEESYGKLSPADNQKVEKEANRTSVRLFGFDANKEDHYFIARYLIEQLDRYPSFRGRDLNSPSPRIDGYRRMYRVFEAPWRQN